MIWTQGEHGPTCKIGPFGEVSIECAEWFSPPWTACFFDRQGSETQIRKSKDQRTFDTEAEAKDAAKLWLLSFDVAIQNALVQGCNVMDDGE